METVSEILVMLAQTTGIPVVLCQCARDVLVLPQLL